MFRNLSAKSTLSSMSSFYCNLVKLLLQRFQVPHDTSVQLMFEKLAKPATNPFYISAYFLEWWLVSLRVSVACHDPNFVLAEETHQMAWTLRIDSNDLIFERDHEYNTQYIQNRMNLILKNQIIRTIEGETMKLRCVSVLLKGFIQSKRWANILAYLKLKVKESTMIQLNGSWNQWILNLNVMNVVVDYVEERKADSYSIKLVKGESYTNMLELNVSGSLRRRKNICKSWF